MELITKTYKNAKMHPFVGDWKFWFKLFMIIYIFASLAYQYAIGIIGIRDHNDAYAMWFKDMQNEDYSSFTAWFFMSFANQITLLVGIWYIFAVIMHNREVVSRVLNFNWSIAMASYLSIAAIGFHIAVLPYNIDTYKNFTDLEWFFFESIRVIIPFIFVVYLLAVSPRDEILDMKSFISQKSWKYLFYPFVYIVISMLRGEMYYRGSLGLDNYTNKELWYPYYFFRVHSHHFNGVDVSGTVLFFTAFIVMLGGAFGLACLYNFIALKVNKGSKLRGQR